MNNLRYYFKEGAGNMFTHGFMSFAAVGITVACLLIMGTFTLIAYNAGVNLEELQQENAVVGFVDETLSDEKAKTLHGYLEEIDGVADCTFVSRQEARDAYVEEYDENGLYADLSANVFRHRYVMHLTDPEKMSEVKNEIGMVDGIDYVRGDEFITGGFITIRNVARAISLTLIAVLLIVSLFIISNTIKLTTFDRREEIAIMKMVGATDSFIRWPFVYEGLLLGLTGAVVAFVLQWALYTGVQQSIVGNDTLQLIQVVDFSEIWPLVAISFTAAGVLIGALGSVMAIRRFLKV